MEGDFDLEDDEEDEFVPLQVMPTMRLNDIYAKFDRSTSSVVNLDALIPPLEAGEEVLQSLFYKMPRSTRTLSLRFNNLSPFSVELLIDWVSQNDYLETLYVMGCGIDDKNRLKLEDAWKKNYTGHRTDNLGYTFYRVDFSKVPVEEDNNKKNNNKK
eukprot:gene3767-4117_t